MKNPIRKAFPEHATFRRDNSILNLSMARAAHLGFRRSKQLEILDLLMQLALHVMSVMPLNLTKRLPAVSYAGNRPFLDQGKSQKALNRQNPPLTIEKFRE